MLATDSPLTEHMTLFWHNHFTSSLKKVKVPDLLYQQNALYRTHALGNFATLLRAAAKDPAMLVYLDNNLNQPDHPNENFARELMELFTLGEGHGYTETDVREAARAFTGWRFRPDQGFVANNRAHDNGSKTFLGHTGNFNGDDILNILLEQPRVAEYITEKLWRDLISDRPDALEVSRLAGAFRKAKYEIKPLVEAMLQTDAFRAPDNRGTMVKSPVDLVVGTYRLIGFEPREPRTMVLLGRAFGQDLLDPPNVKGWSGGLNWIDTATLPERFAFLNVVAQGLDTAQEGTVARRRAAAAAPPPPPRRVLPPQLQAPAANDRPDPAERPFNVAGLDGNSLARLTELQTEQLAALVLPVAPTRGATDRPSPLASLIVDPAYQLK